MIQRKLAQLHFLFKLEFDCLSATNNLIKEKQEEAEEADN
jgi:hypothetical protein